MTKRRHCGFCEIVLPPGRRRWCSEGCRQRWLRDDNRHAKALGVTVEAVRNWRRNHAEQVAGASQLSTLSLGGESDHA